ncbi:MAG: alpha/beta fold hydrolase [Thermoguttaceae bacterium]
MNAYKTSADIWSPHYPFESHFFDLDGMKYHYVDEQRPRNATNREVLLMVHGNPTWSFFWRKPLIEFRDRYRVIAIDHIGCGLSDKPSELDYQFTLERRIDDLCRFIEAKKLERITLVAHDWGGAVGMGAATRFPEKFDRFILMNTAAFISHRCPLRIRVCRTPILGRIALQGLNLFSRGTLLMATAKRSNLPRDIRAGYLAPYNNWANRLAVYRFVKDIPLSPDHPSFRTLSEIETNIQKFKTKPVCLIWGMLDWCFSPEFLKRFLQIFPEADVHRLDQAHHLLLEDAPDDVLAAMETFLSANRSSADYLTSLAVKA